MAQSLFQPYLIVDDDGTITVDWSDAYAGTTLDMSGAETVYEGDAAERHAAIFDAVLNTTEELTPATRLRLLADYIEKRSA